MHTNLTAKEDWLFFSFLAASFLLNDFANILVKNDVSLLAIDYVVAKVYPLTAGARWLRFVEMSGAIVTKRRREKRRPGPGSVTPLF